VAQVDSDFLARVMSIHESGLHYLGATSEHPEEELARLPQATVELTGQVLGALKRRFTALVLECPMAFWPLGSYILRRSHLVLAVATLTDMASLRSALWVRQMLSAAGVDAERVIPVLSKVEKGNALTLEDFTRVTGWERPRVVPADERNCTMALNEGVPLAIRSPGSPAAEAIGRLAAEVADRARRVTGVPQEAVVASG
jgi:Flp pilus assembly CpaE family ATPase